MSTPADPAAGLDGSARLRRRLYVRGLVQGVGFRPAVSRFANALALDGFVRNDRDGVSIEVEGPAPAVARFVAELPSAYPAIARVDDLEAVPLPVSGGEPGFRIALSLDDAAGMDARASVPADLAPCADCLRELFDPADRRYRYPFINCTACGPRFTIVRALPYDRGRTTMTSFTMCAACQREYDDPADRRFHAEPNACPACGPRLRFVWSGSAAGCLDEGEAALEAAARAIAAGLIVAVKGAGGFLLAVDAANPEAVERLRARKRRPHKPFAVMGRSPAALERAVILDQAARRALESTARPIVLAPARARGEPAAVAANVAPGLTELGVFLPPTPLQQLLLADGPPLQVMTSGNLSEEPIACDNDEALRRLAGVADAFLLHDRDVHTRADDSVVRVTMSGPALLRRARGFVPDAIPLPVTAAAAAPVPVLAVGAEWKATVCLTRAGQAILSQHLGDLDDADSFAFFEETVSKLARLAGVEPRVIAHDLHPNLRSTRWARATGLPLEPVQHHHAHVASCLAEHGRAEPVLGVAFDGTGYGPDGTLWGGEIMLADLGGFRRLGHLGHLPLLGGEAAIRAPWRLAVAALLGAREDPDLVPGVTQGQVRALGRIWDRPDLPQLAPRASGAGRWFDAVAALCGVRREVSYEGQAAVELEAAAADGAHAPYQIAFQPGDPFVIDLRPAVQAIAFDLRRAAPAAEIAARFHATMAHAIAESCRRARKDGAPGVVALSGGCFQSRRLTELARSALERLGFEVLVQRLVPCNDGGLALGQAAVASWRLAARAAARRGAAPCA